MKKLLIIAALSLMGMNSYAKQDLYCPAVVYCPAVGRTGCVISANWKVTQYTSGTAAPGYMTFIQAQGWPLPYPANPVNCMYNGKFYGQSLTIQSIQYNLRPDNKLFGNRWTQSICTAVDNSFACPFVYAD
jgi:hypothetical protein